MTDTEQVQATSFAKSQGFRVAAVFAFLVAAMVAFKAPHSLVIWALDGVVALLILATATCVGLGLLRSLRLNAISWHFQVSLAAGLGLGFLSLLTLACGTAGWIGAGHRYVLPGIFLATGAIGFLLRTPIRLNCPAVAEQPWVRWLVLATTPIAAIIVLGATLPPGVAWQEEGHGYDVLEYHLQTPKEYFDAGRIEYLPHNVYASFPSNAEMLFLFGNQFMGETIDAWPIAKCTNALIVLLIGFAAYAIGREASVGCGVGGAVVAGTCGWLAYLGGIAYVEGGMLLMGMLSVGCLMQFAKTDERNAAIRWIALAGVLAGLACGFKYTAVVFFAIPIGAMILVISKQPMSRHIHAVLVFCLGCTLTFAPWLIKNAVMTNNPVFPLLGSWFDSDIPGWGEAESVHFAASHQPLPDEQSVGQRFGLIWKRIIADSDHRFGAVMLALAVVAWAKHRSRLDAALSLMLLVQIIAWMTVTHLYARFAIPMLVPLILLAARGAVSKCQSLTKPFAIVLLAGAFLNSFFAYQLYARHTEHAGQRFNLEGATNAFTDGVLESERHVGYVNQEIPAEARVLLVGDARAFYLKRKCDYCVVFNRNPFAEVAESAPSPAVILDWLRDQGYTHVLVHYSEMRRLRGTYGFWDSITPSLFEQLAGVGLKEVARFAVNDGANVYAVLYEVPGSGSSIVE
ncbi:MAG: hypothetical protein DHS20C16_10600 [Phycisphaerae bacterium]|nr:MAG: hypothetical protein DHS20C16_10600 [Phycisphaerae bacterium]